MTNTVNGREIALDVLMEVNEKEQYLHVLLNEALRKYQYFEKNERAFISRLVRGTIERRITLDYVINQVSTVKINKMKPLIRNLLRMSVYQMMYMEQVPDSAVCNEAVKLAKKRHFGNLSGFVNGVLRNICRQLPDMRLPDTDSIRYSMPQELLDILESAYGRKALSTMLESFMSENPVSIITNTARCTSTELMNHLTEDGINVMKAPYVKDAFIISGFNYLEDIKAFEEGLFQVQDISSMLEGVIAAPEQGNRIVDVCAAPGGKSIFASLMLKGTGQVVARDISDRKTEQISENIERLGLDNISVETMDATCENIEDVSSADIVLADVPCSGIGIIGRKPDIKYNLDRQKLEGITALQRRILDVACTYVKHGGYIVYSTCTLNPQENEANVGYIEQMGFRPEDITSLLPEQVIEDSRKAGSEFYDKLMDDAKKGYITLLPGIYECDGFFVAKLRRI